MQSGGFRRLGKRLPQCRTAYPRAKTRVMIDPKILSEPLVVELLSLAFVQVPEPDLPRKACFGVSDRDVPTDASQLCVAEFRDPSLAMYCHGSGHGTMLG